MKRSQGEVVLVTGYPSFRARKMVDHLLAAEPTALLYLIVREKFAAEAQAALDQLPRADRERVVVIEGDAAAMDLGLSGKEYRELASRVERTRKA